MHDQATGPAAGGPGDREKRPSGRRARIRDAALQCASQKRADGVPTYSVAEPATLLRVSHEYRHRLVRGGVFPSPLLHQDADHGRSVVSAQAVVRLLEAAYRSGARLDAPEGATDYQASPAREVAV